MVGKMGMNKENPLTDTSLLKQSSMFSFMLCDDLNVSISLLLKSKTHFLKKMRYRDRISYFVLIWSNF